MWEILVWLHTESSYVPSRNPELHLLRVCICFTQIGSKSMLQYRTGVMSTSATQLQALLLKSLMMVLTGECIDHSAILGHILLMKWLNTHFNFHSQYFSLLLDALLNILKVEECMNYSHCSPEGWNFYWVGTLFLQRTSHNKISLFSPRLPHRIFSSLSKSSSHRKHHQPKHPDRSSHTDGFSKSNVITKNFFWEMQRKSVFQRWKTCNPTWGESGKLQIELK